MSCLFERLGRLLALALSLLLVGAASAAKVEIIPLEPVEPIPAQVRDAEPDPTEEITASTQAVPGSPARWFSPERPFVALLPLSGEGAPAGQQLAEALKKVAGDHLLAVIDTELFEADELARIARLYDPQWVFGPLRRRKADAFAREWPQLPMLRPATSCPAAAQRCLALLPSPARLFFHHLWPEPATRTLYVLEPLFWQRLPQPLQASLQRAHGARVLQQASEAALARGVGLAASQRRINWLRSTLQHPVESVPRPRQDLDRVVMVLPLEPAYQVRSLLNFWQLPAEQFIWLPPSPVRPAQLWQAGRFWPPTQAYLPPLFLQKNSADKKVGIFYALSETVASLLQHRFMPGWVTPLGVATEDRYGWRLDIKPVELQGVSLRSIENQ